MSTPAQIWGTTTSVTLDTSSPTDDHADTVLHSDHVAHPNQRSSRREGPGGLVLSALNSGVTMRAIPEPQGPPILRMTSSDPARKVGPSMLSWGVIAYGGALSAVLAVLL